MKKSLTHIFLLFLVDTSFTIGSTHMYFLNKGLTMDIVAILLGLIVNIMFINEVHLIIKNIYQIGIQRGRLEVQNTFKKEN